MTTDVDVLVVGAGPAGAVVARELARTGVDVLVVDRARFPRDKVCGGCLGAGALALLDEAGIDVPDGPELAALDLAVGRRRARIPLAPGRSISRAALDAALLDAARETGATVRTGVEARLGSDLGDARLVHLVDAGARPARLADDGRRSTEDERASSGDGSVDDGCARDDGTRRRSAGGGTIRAGLVLAADGLAGTLVAGSRAARRSRIGAGARLARPERAPPTGTIEMTCGPGGYVGATVDETGRLTVAAALDPGRVREGGIVGAVDGILASAGRPPLPEGRWHGTPALTRGAPPPAARVLSLGDAAGYVEPFTGEGMTWAIRSAHALAPLARRGWTADLPKTWDRLRRRLVRRGTCRSAAALLRRPRLAAAAVALLDMVPGLGTAWARAVHRR